MKRTLGNATMLTRLTVHVVQLLRSLGEEFRKAPIVGEHMLEIVVPHVVAEVRHLGQPRALEARVFDVHARVELAHSLDDVGLQGVHLHGGQTTVKAWVCAHVGACARMHACKHAHIAYACNLSCWQAGYMQAATHKHSRGMRAAHTSVLLLATSFHWMAGYLIVSAKAMCTAFWRLVRLPSNSCTSGFLARLDAGSLGLDTGSLGLDVRFDEGCDEGGALNRMLGSPLLRVTGPPDERSTLPPASIMCVDQIARCKMAVLCGHQISPIRTPLTVEPAEDHLELGLLPRLRQKGIWSFGEQRHDGALGAPGLDRVGAERLISEDLGTTAAYKSLWDNYVGKCGEV